MGKSRVKGIVVEIGGDTTGLDKALSGTNKNISNTQRQLKDVERLLKLDPNNTVLLGQKQRLLAQATEETKEKLQILNEANDQLRSDVGKPVNAAQFDSLQREIAATEQALERLEEKGKVSLEAISDKAGKVADTFQPVTTAVAGLGAAAVATVPATEELREDLSRLDANARENAVSIDAARAAWKALAVQSGETDSAVEATSNLLQAGFTESNLQKAVEGLAGAAQRFPDTLKVESLADSLQETLATGAATGQFSELLERLGLNVEDFNTAMAECATAAQRQDLALQTLANAGLNDSYAAWKANNEEMLANKEANLELEISMAKLAETVLPAVTRITNAVADFLDWFGELPKSAQISIVAILAVAAAISPMASAVSNAAGLIETLSKTNLPGLTTAFGTLTGKVLPGVQGAFSSVFGFIAAHPVVLLIAAIVGLVALIATKGDEIQGVLQGVDDFMQGVFARDWTEVFGPVLGAALNGFFAKLKGIWDSIYSVLNGVIDFIRGVFTGDWERAWNGVVQIFDGIFSGLASLLESPINSVIGLINSAIDSINWLIDGINRVPSINVPTIKKHIPFLADGGEVLNGSAVVGEAGPELLTVLGDRTVVQPLTSNTTNHSTHLGAVNVNVYGAPGQDVRELAEIVLDEIQSICDSEEAGL